MAIVVAISFPIIPAVTTPFAIPAALITPCFTIAVAIGAAIVAISVSPIVPVSAINSAIAIAVYPTVYPAVAIAVKAAVNFSIPVPVETTIYPAVAIAVTAGNGAAAIHPAFLPNIAASFQTATILSPGLAILPGHIPVCTIETSVDIAIALANSASLLSRFGAIALRADIGPSTIISILGPCLPSFTAVCLTIVASLSAVCFTIATAFSAIGLTIAAAAASIGLAIAAPFSAIGPTLTAPVSLQSSNPGQVGREHIARIV